MTRFQEFARTMFAVVGIIGLGGLAHLQDASVAPFTTLIGVVLVATVYVAVGLAPHRHR